jgi:hypothetical protein
MKNITTLLFLFFFIFSFSQIKGTVTDEKGNPLPFVNIYIKDTYISTTTNDIGKYELNVKNTGTSIILYQFVGFKTEKRSVDVSIPQTINVTLFEENYQLNEVVINAKENPANEIIRKAIANRKQNSEKTARYTADFYSRGIFRVKNLPKSIMGQKLDFFDEMIDSTRSGILYLSETVSKVTFQKPDKMKEIIVASKVSGNDNGFSFNNAASANFDLYENYVEFDTKVVSPIADNAFSYYKYKFEGSIIDENNRLIDKIKVISKRNTEPAFNGYIYIVDDSYAIYAVDVSVTGKQIQNPALNTLTIKQNYSYNNTNKIWAKNTQTLDFEAGFLGVNISGRFTYVFSNFEFEKQFDKKTFGSEILKFEKDANKKENSFWETIRPVPLTDEETKDYLKKDLLQEKKKSKVYLDSIDSKRNKFRFFDILNGYTYSNSYNKWSINYDGPLLNTSFNTVQGWKTQIGLAYSKRDVEKRTYARFGTKIDFGFSEKKLRGIGFYTQKFNNINNSTLSINGGNMVSQFNSNNPISNIVNTVSSLFFVNNFMKLFEKNFISGNFSREIINGLNMNLNLEYSERKPLFNTTNQTAVKSNDTYFSNNPLLPNDFVTPGLIKHNLVKVGINSRIVLGQKFITRPDGKYNIGNDGKYPVINLGYEKAMAATNKNYEFDLLTSQVTHDLSFGNKGELTLNLRAGKFFNANNISFVDYKHFNGNQTHVSNGDAYTNVFNNLPYYAASTNNSYFEAHFEHNDKGFIMNKIPLLNKLQSQLVLGFHNLAIPERKPYQEFTIGLDNLGFGKFKMFRVDYVRSYQNGYQGDAVIFGLKFLNVVN